MPLGEQGEQDDEEKAALRHHIHQLEEAAARGELTARQAAASQATDDERLEAALQQERLQARIRQLEVFFSGCFVCTSPFVQLHGPGSSRCTICKAMKLMSMDVLNGTTAEGCYSLIQNMAHVLLLVRQTTCFL